MYLEIAFAGLVLALAYALGVVLASLARVYITAFLMVREGKKYQSIVQDRLANMIQVEEPDKPKSNPYL